MESAKQLGHELAQEKYLEMQSGDGESRPRFLVNSLLKIRYSFKDSGTLRIWFRIGIGHMRIRGQSIR